MIHKTSVRLMLRSCTIVGIKTLTMLPSSTMSETPRRIAISAHQGFFSCAGPSVEVVVAADIRANSNGVLETPARDYLIPGAPRAVKEVTRVIMVEPWSTPRERLESPCPENPTAP